MSTSLSPTSGLLSMQINKSISEVFWCVVPSQLHGLYSFISLMPSGLSWLTGRADAGPFMLYRRCFGFVIVLEILWFSDHAAEIMSQGRCRSIFQARLVLSQVSARWPLQSSLSTFP